MDSHHKAHGLAPLCLAAIVLAPIEQGAVRIATDSPRGLLRCFEETYEARDAGAYAGLFTQDFRFFFGDDDLRARYPQGWGRGDEVASARHLFEGFRDAAGVYRPPAQEIELTLCPCSVLPDPERADSEGWYRMVLAPEVRLAIRTATGGFLVDRQPHVFRLVRGDAAALDGDQPADADHWYVRRWDEGAQALALAMTATAAERGNARRLPGGPVGRPAVAMGPRLPFRLAGVWPNPSLGTVGLSVAVRGDGPSRLELVDVAGRIRARRELGVLAAGDHRLVWNLNRAVGVGVYWVRLCEAQRAEARRVVIVQ